MVFYFCCYFSCLVFITTFLNTIILVHNCLQELRLVCEFGNIKISKFCVYACLGSYMCVSACTWACVCVCVCVVKLTVNLLSNNTY